MTDRLSEVLRDLAAEGDALDALVAPLTAEQWGMPTPAEGWTVAHQIAHLAWTDEVAVLAATDKHAWDAVVAAALMDPDTYVDEAAADGAALPPEELLSRWRAASTRLATTLAERDPEERIDWFGPPMTPTSMATARLMETWAHGHDVADAIGAEMPVTDRLRHVVHLGVRTRNFAFGVRDLDAPREEFRVELRGPDDQVWTFGPEDAEQQVRGSAYDFCLLVTQRRHRADLDLEAVGPDADRWLDIAQAFAGPPGPGREPQRAEG
jgi:uncharacterized protein (TIGR03084 family)